jgi:transcription elongation GreA/GreB family factor
MSRAFVTEDSTNQPEDLPERQPSGLPNYVTPQGRAGLRRRISELDAAHKALKLEKSDDPLHRQRIRLVERDITYYEHRLKTAILVDNSGCGAGEVRFGALVEIRDESGALQKFAIVGEDEADAAAGKISWASPLASVLLGACPGTTVTWKREAGETRLEIVSLDYPKAPPEPG